MKQFKTVNTIMGWITFAIAAFVYCSTIEPTASFWDCPEFITSAYKLEVGHPPGNPFFMLTANLFTQFASDPTQVARMVNIMSALFSAGCILFLFWSITHLTRKLVCSNPNEMSLSQLITIQGSGLVGALAYTFSDTFWFSAVEGEVYAYSSLFTAMVFWLILKWEEHADEPHSDRWLVLISYMTGISIGVHLLNLLCVPALVLVWYYKRNPQANLKGSLLALIGSMVLVAAVLYGIVPGIVKVGGWFELFFVNTLGFSFNTGLIVYIFCLIAVVLWAIWETQRQASRKRMNIAYLCAVAMLGIPFYGYGWSSLVIGVIILAILAFVLYYKKEDLHVISARVMNTSLLCMLMIMIGYSSYALIVIRSSANPPMDQNSPEDVFTLGQYLNREQYGTRPLFYGQAYTSQMKLKTTNEGYCVPVTKEGAPVYQRVEKHSKDEKDAYEIVRHDLEYVYAQNMLFPRMYSDRHAQAYESWMGGVDGKTEIFDRCGEMVNVKVPTQLENLRFFFSYQLNFMYWRYFMWNFAGRQNDIQGNGEAEHGNWITGISFLDDLRLGDQSKLPTELKENKGHNVFYCMPLILGILGLLWQIYKNDKGVQQFWVVFFLFFMTGIAIVIYLNQTPMQPRERDYAYAGSFYAFAIWIGMGVAALTEWLRKYIKTNETVLASVISLVALMVPIQMASQTWDDHDRSGRYTCPDFGKNYLQSLDEKGNPIIFTNGDNDTFPLWYLQETEGFRTDARVCNLSYLQTDWYIDQMKRPAYDSPSIPISWNRLQYVGGVREGIQVHPDALEQVIALYKDNPEEMKQMLGENPYELKNIMKHWVLNDNPDLQIIPTDSVVITIDKEAVKRSGMMVAGDSIPDVMSISLKGKRAIYKSELMMLDMLAQTNWERPLYIAMTVGPDNYGNLGDHFVQEGLAYRVTPFNTTKTGKRMDTERMYNNVMNKFKFGGANTPGVYLDETVMRMCYTHRRVLAQLALQLIKENKPQKALQILNKAEKELPSYNVPDNYQSGSVDLAKAYAALNKKAEAEKILTSVGDNSKEYLSWYLSLSNNRLLQSSSECSMHLYILNEVSRVLDQIKSAKTSSYTTALNTYAEQCLNRGVSLY